MEYYFKMKTIKDKVRFFLSQERTKHLRDSDEKLIATIYYYEIGEEAIRGMSAIGFLKMYANRELPTAESIRRVRQSLQEKEPELRGNAYNDRQRQEKGVRMNVKNL